MKVAFWLWMAVSAAVLPQAAAQAPRLALEIQSEHATLRAGDEIPITFVLTNVGTTNYAFTDRSYDRSGRLWDYRLRAEDDRGLPVPDPRTLFSRGQAYIGGGLGTPSELQPGLRVTKTIALNLWAVVTEPGVYMVRGSYTTDNGQSVESPALTLRVLPRTYEEMGRHIEELATQLQDASDGEARVQLIQRPDVHRRSAGGQAPSGTLSAGQQLRLLDQRGVHLLPASLMATFRPNRHRHS